MQAGFGTPAQTVVTSAESSCKPFNGRLSVSNRVKGKQIDVWFLLQALRTSLQETPFTRESRTVVLNV